MSLGLQLMFQSRQCWQLNHRYCTAEGLCWQSPLAAQLVFNTLQALLPLSAALKILPSSLKVESWSRHCQWKSWCFTCLAVTGLYDLTWWDSFSQWHSTVKRGPQTVWHRAKLQQALDAAWTWSVLPSCCKENRIKRCHHMARAEFNGKGSFYLSVKTNLLPFSESRSMSGRDSHNDKNTLPHLPSSPC